jgi:DTW domain-containing protein YfiP
MHRRLTMPSRSRKTDHCLDCRLFRPFCVCEIIAETRLTLADVTTRVVVLMHVREVSLPTNTARLATAAIPGSELRLRGVIGQEMSTQGLIESERQSLLLYPSEDAIELNAEAVKQWDKPLTLLVPDGSWRQARKAAGRIAGLSDLPRVKLPPGPPSRYRLRKEPNERSVSTFEAIARALGQLEGEKRGPLVQHALEELFELRIERTLWSRGVIPTEECRFPIPPKVFEAFAAAGARGGEKSKAMLAEARMKASLA